MQIREYMDKNPNFTWDAGFALLSISMQLNRKNLGKIFFDDQKLKYLTPTRKEFWDKLAEFNIKVTENDRSLIEEIIDP
jgi:hypothetical protein